MTTDIPEHNATATSTSSSVADSTTNSATAVTSSSSVSHPVFRATRTALIWTSGGETVQIEAWGANSVRVRARFMQPIADHDWALLAPTETEPTIRIEADKATLTNGNLSVIAHLNHFTHHCDLEFVDNQGKTLFKEIGDGGALRLKARKYEPLAGGMHRTTVRFETNTSEHLYGMGEYQQPVMDLKGTSLELAHRNSQVSVPFVVSSRGYGFLWHNPAVGQATFATNVTTWQASACEQIDYWVTAGSMQQIEQQYADATGHAPVMPEWGLGFWQCKLRYWNQEQLLEKAREFKRRHIPVDVIVIDFFHWPLMGDFRFDSEFWPDPQAMADELHEMGIKLMVSVWPQIDLESENYDTMYERNYLAHTTQGKDVGMWWPRDNQFFDATNPEARAWLWQKIKQNYIDNGVDAFWLDEAEPEWGGDYDYSHYYYHIGAVNAVGNVYPALYNKTFYDGQISIGKQDDIINLTRAAWAGSQRYGSLVWSGDVHSTFADLRAQITCAIHMGVAGIPWFTTDMGGFAGGDPNNPDFKELYVRWCQFSCFSPVMRNHGDRMPGMKVPGKPTVDRRGNPIDHIHTGADNEPWSYGEEVEHIVTHYIQVREALRPYTRELFTQAHESGQPVVRGLFYEFASDEAAANIADEYMFGTDLLIAPVTELGATKRSVYLPGDNGTQWLEIHTGKTYCGGTTVEAQADLAVVPVFARNGATHGLESIL